MLRNPKKLRFCLPWVIYLLFSYITGTMNHKTMLPDIFFLLKWQDYKEITLSLCETERVRHKVRACCGTIFSSMRLFCKVSTSTQKRTGLGWRVGAGEDEEMHSSWTEMCFYGPITGLSIILTEASKQTYMRNESRPVLVYLSFLSSQPKSAFAT